ncbi:hypothetical protein L1765_14680 [Microaerobacter geothermalis]|uniref:hypothetical protein n=1 Tax=Microaerobacter geothermalis TaxID=674972 RepID=UPI001F1FEFA8|nr:hypothetical protein [Microaerobacter geothermalis]MCF6095206.1 hypothetical protein [Microaerobacter geothermalis]
MNEKEYTEIPSVDKPEIGSIDIPEIGETTVHPDTKSPETKVKLLRDPFFRLEADFIPSWTNYKKIPQTPETLGLRAGK